jgi:dTDP-4-dehydrorhamnose 3,5-epimerase
MPFSFESTTLPGVMLIETKLFSDNRGFFTESYKHSDFSQAGIPEIFVQDNFSFSVRGVLRGLHYQKAPYAQAKLVFVTRGEIFDVAVDIRKQSPTYGQWTGAALSGDSGRMLYIPCGFAHGFCVLSPEAYVTYKVTAEYNPALDRGIIWNDPDVQIAWPVKDPLLSPKDAGLPFLRDADNDFVY